MDFDFFCCRRKIFFRLPAQANHPPETTQANVDGD